MSSEEERDRNESLIRIQTLLNDPSTPESPLQSKSPDNIDFSIYAKNPPYLSVESPRRDTFTHHHPAEISPNQKLETPLPRVIGAFDSPVSQGSDHVLPLDGKAVLTVLLGLLLGVVLGVLVRRGF